MTTTTAPIITLDDVLRALMETRNTIQANAEAVRIRFEQEAQNRLEEKRLLVEEARLRAEREAEQAKKRTEREVEQVRLRAEEAKEEARLRTEREAEQVRLRAEEAKEEARLRAEREAEQARLRAEREAEAKASRMDFDKRMKELSKQLGGHANRLGEFVQEMVKPAVVRLFQERGLPVHQVLPNMEGKSKDNQPQVEIEVDLVVVNTQVLIAVECKSHLTQEAVDEHLERLTLFKRCFPQFANYVVLGAVAGMVMSKEVSRYAHKNGLFVLAQSGSSIEIRNPSGFDAKEW
ncbi:MAG: hypothetical protein RIR79_822 [Pseudomonadota bacterium]|jgi:hypothetical protein